MPDTTSKVSGDSSQREAYGLADEQFRAELRMRTAAGEAAFFLPWLRPGMSLLDCGCGPGTITLGLARAVAPGKVAGIDISPTDISEARAIARERGITNVRFAVGNIYELPFPDASFDAAFAHAVLQHLGDPLRALKEMRRVLKPGGVIGVRDPDRSVQIREPSSLLLQLVQAIWLRFAQHNGGSPFYARQLRRLLREAGFVRTELSAAAISTGTLELTRLSAQQTEVLLRSATETAIAQGWTDRETIEAMSRELRVWAEHPDAFYVLLMYQALGWVGDTTSD